LAFFGHGESHLKAGPYRGAIDKGLKWLVKAQKKDGDLRGGGKVPLWPNYLEGRTATELLIRGYDGHQQPYPNTQQDS